MKATTFAESPAKLNRKGVTMIRFIALCVLMLFPFGAKAEPPPPVPEGGLNHYESQACTDPVTGLDGNCYYSHDMRNNFYMAFYTLNDLCMYIEQKIDGQYVEIWRRGADV